jgi:hypothetical protein
MNTFYNFHFVKQATKRLQSLICLAILFTLMSCVSTEDFYAANDINKMDNNLTTLLVKAINSNNTNEKHEIAFTAALAHDSGDSMAEQGKAKLAIAYYRIAAIAYWQDDIDANDNQLIAVMDASQALCKSLQSDGKAPDRDCFVIQLTLLLEVIEQKFEDIAQVDQVDFTSTNIKGIRQLVDDIGVGAAPNSAQINGFLPSFIDNVKNNAAFLRNHPTMQSYIRDNLVTIITRYKNNVSEVKTFYTRQGNNSDLATLNATHPVYTLFLNTAGNTNEERVNLMIDTWLAGS